jgi:carbonic anhydrase/acetyltransferase-like protein (isoleucine patch superfamily)
MNPPVNPVRPFEEHSPEIGERVYIADQALVLGQVTIGDDTSIWPMTVVRGDVHSIQIGARSNIQDGSVLHVTHDSDYNPGGFPLTIGDDVTVGHSVILHGCTIGDRCLIGMGALVMDGAVIEDDVVLGAGSLVTQGKCLEGGYLWVGRPVRRLRKLSDKQKEGLVYSAQHYVRLKDRYLG